MGNPGWDQNSSAMIKIAILVCLAGLAAGRPDTTWLSPSSYSAWPLWGFESPLRTFWPGYTKREAEAEADPEADAEYFYGPYLYLQDLDNPLKGKQQFKPTVFRNGQEQKQDQSQILRANLNNPDFIGPINKQEQTPKSRDNQQFNTKQADQDLIGPQESQILGVQLDQAKHQTQFNQDQQSFPQSLLNPSSMGFQQDQIHLILVGPKQYPNQFIPGQQYQDQFTPKKQFQDQFTSGQNQFKDQFTSGQQQFQDQFTSGQNQFKDQFTS